MTLASQTMPTSATVSTAQSHGVEASSSASLADSIADAAIVDASEAKSSGLLNSAAASVADSIADAAIIDASEAKSTGLIDSSAASVTKSLAVYSDPGSDEYPVKEIVMDASLDMIVTYDDSSIA